MPSIELSAVISVISVVLMLIGLRYVAVIRSQLERANSDAKDLSILQEGASRDLRNTKSALEVETNRADNLVIVHNSAKTEASKALQDKESELKATRNRVDDLVSEQEKIKSLLKQATDHADSILRMHADEVNLAEFALDTIVAQAIDLEARIEKISRIGRSESIWSALMREEESNPSERVVAALSVRARDGKYYARDMQGLKQMEDAFESLMSTRLNDLSGGNIFRTLVGRSGVADIALVVFAGYSVDFDNRALDEYCKLLHEKVESSIGKCSVGYVASYKRGSPLEYLYLAEVASRVGHGLLGYSTSPWLRRLRRRQSLNVGDNFRLDSPDMMAKFEKAQNFLECPDAGARTSTRYRPRYRKIEGSTSFQVSGIDVSPLYKEADGEVIVGDVEFLAVLRDAANGWEVMISLIDSYSALLSDGGDALLLNDAIKLCVPVLPKWLTLSNVDLLVKRLSARGNLGHFDFEILDDSNFQIPDDIVASIRLLQKNGCGIVAEIYPDNIHLSRVVDWSPDMIKISTGFTEMVVSSDRISGFVSAISTYLMAPDGAGGKLIGDCIIVEGIRDLSQLAFFERIGVRMFQGGLFSRATGDGSTSISAPPSWPSIEESDLREMEGITEWISAELDRVRLSSPSTRDSSTAGAGQDRNFGET